MPPSAILRQRDAAPCRARSRRASQRVPRAGRTPVRPDAEIWARRRSRRATSSKACAQFAQRSVERRARRARAVAGGRAAACAPSASQQRCVLLQRYRRALLAISCGDARQQVAEAGQAVARRLREIGAAEKRRAVRRQEHGQRPAAAALGQHGWARLVDLVEVGALLAVDLDVDEVLGSSPPRRPASSNDSCAITWHQWQAE